MWNITNYNLKKQSRGIGLYLASLVGFTWMYIALFPSMQKIDIEAMMSQMPKEFTAFLGEGGAAAYSKIEGFLSGEFLSFFFVLLIGFYVSAAAGSAIAGAIEKRTMDFELSQPTSRSTKILAETVVALLYSAILVVATNASIKILCELYDISISGMGLFYFSIVATLFAWALFGIAILISSIVRSKMVVVGITMFLTLGSYIFYSLSLAVEKIRDFGHYTLYNFYDPQKILTKAEISFEQCLVFAAIFIIGTSAALLIFNKKDV